MANPNMMTVKEAAEYLGLPQSAVYALIRNGKLGHFRYRTGNSRGTIRLEEAEVERYLLSCTVPPKPTAILLAIREQSDFLPEDKWGDGG